MRSGRATRVSRAQICVSLWRQRASHAISPRVLYCTTKQVSRVAVQLDIYLIKREHGTRVLPPLASFCCSWQQQLLLLSVVHHRNTCKK